MRKTTSKGKQIKYSKPKGQQLIFGPQANIFDRKQILQKQNKLKKLYEANKYDPATEYFGKIKFQFVIYTIGQFIEIYSLNPNQSIIAKLTKVIKLNLPELPELKAFVEVEWVLRKNDLPQMIQGEFKDFISSAEVFPSNEKIYLYVESIKNKCTILDIEEYGELGLTSETIYYTRSNFDNESKQIVPSPYTWASDCCYCRKPNNPDLVMVACSKCSRWFHNDCVLSQIIHGHFMCEKCFADPAE